MPEELDTEVKAAVNAVVEEAARSLAVEPNRSLAQGLLDVAGPPKEDGLMNADGMAGGWVFTNVLTPPMQGAVRQVHARQWGAPGGGGGPHGWDQ